MIPNINSTRKIKLKTISLVAPIKHNFILNNMTFTSKNIYNCCIFTNNIMSQYKNKVYKKVYNLFNNISKSEKYTNEEKLNTYKNNKEIILHFYKKI